MRLFPRLFFVFFFVFISVSAARALEPFFKKGDIIALVGGEDMVAASEYGYLELLLVRALPDHRLRFRNLAWEGDTVFEQRRDLNFPTWEEQLDKIGATVVIAQFGQMESIMGTRAPGFPVSGSAGAPPAVAGAPPGTPRPTVPQNPPPAGGAPAAAGGAPALPDFIAAYEKLIERFSAGGNRRVILISPSPFAGEMNDARNQRLDLFWRESAALCRQPGQRSVHVSRSILSGAASARGAAARILEMPQLRGIPQVATEQAFSKARATLQAAAMSHRDDGAHLSAYSHARIAHLISNFLNPPRALTPDSPVKVPFNVPETTDPLLQLIIAKNRLWFDYWRPQNWAFLAGDRTAQPSSRDHLDPSKRWFRFEREAFLPLIEAKEKEIDALAQKLAQP